VAATPEALVEATGCVEAWIYGLFAVPSVQMLDNACGPNTNSRTTIAWSLKRLFHHAVAVALHLYMTVEGKLRLR
jgi:hypothetical protein